MFVLGHIGFGRAVVGPFARTLPFVPFAIGALLPDAIDKSLYYLHLSSFVSCTRTFAHTGLFLGALALAAWGTKSRTWTALAVGAATHPLFDWAMDQFSREPSSALIAFTWPFLQWNFASYDFQSPLDQLNQVWRPRILATEAVGLALLGWEYRRRRTAAGRIDPRTE